MSSLNMQKGTNRIVMTYTLAGLEVSLATAIALVTAGLFARTRKAAVKNGGFCSRQFNNSG